MKRNHALSLVAAVFLMGLMSSGLEAATFVVDRTDDTAAATACTAAANDCSLRGAIITANGTSGDDVITLPAGTYTLSLTSTCEDAAANGDLDIRGEGLTINGAGAGTTIIDGADLDRVFDIQAITAATIATINGVTIRNGTANICTAGTGVGGGIRVVGGQTLNLNDSIVAQNLGEDGGGIFNNGTMHVQDCTISGNDSNNNGGGIFNADSGIEVIERSTVSGNSAPLSGGGLYDNNDPSGVTETTRIVESTFSGNDADSGGGLYADANLADSHINIINSTFSGNTANDQGGGIFVCYGTVNLRNVTVTNNTASSDGGGVALPSCGESVMNLRNTIIAGNTDSTSTLTPDCFLQSPSDLFTENFNLIGNETGCAGLINAANDQVGTSGSPINPRLGPLTNNGGPTQTHALLVTPTPSPAIDSANSAGCFSNDANNGGLLGTDQRGSPRPLDGGVSGPSPARCDIGAFEVGGCGDGFVDPSEACDDGNTTDGDGCSATCTVEACGDGVIQGAEQCDDGNSVDGDGCSANCTNEGVPVCGDGILQAGEECDDGNTVSGDGCAATCDTEIENICNDGIDNDDDGPIDCDDSDCANSPDCVETLCADGIDNDGDGPIDCADSDCISDPACTSFTLLLGDGGCGLVRPVPSDSASTATPATILLLASGLFIAFKRTRRS